TSPGTQRPPGLHRNRALHEANTTVGEHAIGAAGVVAGRALILAEGKTAESAIESAPAPRVLHRARRDDRIARGVPIGPDSPAVALVVVGGKLPGLEVLVAEQQVVHDPRDVAIGVEHLGWGAAGVRDPVAPPLELGIPVPGPIIRDQSFGECD